MSREQNDTTAAPSLVSLWDEAVRLNAAKQVKAAEELCQEILRRKPGNPSALNLLGTMASDTGDVVRALRFFNEAIKAHPSFVDSYINMGNAFMMLDQAKAVLCFQQAHAISPSNISVLLQLWRFARNAKNTELAEQYYKKLLKVIPDAALLERERINYASTVLSSTEDITNWRKMFLAEAKSLKPIDLTNYISELPRMAAQMRLGVTYHGLNNLELRRTYAQSFMCTYPAQQPSTDRAVRKIGFFVDTGHEGVFLKMLGGMLSHWSDLELEPTVICSSQSIDQLRDWISNDWVKFVACPSGLLDLMNTIEKCAFDCLFFLESGASSTSYFLPFFRLAPIQVTSWGSTETTGIPNMDFFLSSVWQEPENAQSHYSEELVLLQHPSIFYYQPILSDHKRKSRKDFDIPEIGHLYVCAQHAWKIHPDFDALAKGVLEGDPEGMLYFIRSKSTSIHEAFEKRLRMNLDDAFTRVAFVPYQDVEGYFAFLAIADVILDTPHFCGGQTTYDALGLNVPIVTLPGEFMRGRTTLACYRIMGITDAIANTADEYVELSINLARDPVKRDALKARIRERSHLLFENHEALAEHIRFFKDKIQKHCKSLEQTKGIKI
jgi:predicted O-linked N-acetylglucosamine transferase (SPINDLY family)